MWPLDRLRPYERNARTHSPEQVAQIVASIQEFGFTNPLLVDGADGILAGHGRLAAAKDMGLAVVPVIVLDHLSATQRKAYILADNQLALNAGWDMDALRLELGDLQLEDFDLSLIGFSDEQLADLMPEVEQLPPEDADADAVPEPPADPVTQPGDVWLLGKHRVMCGDSTAITDVERLMDGTRVDLLLTDPPYNVALGMDETPEEAKKRNRRTDGLTIQNDKMQDDDFRQFLRDVYSAADSVMNEGAVFYVWHADSEGYNFRGAAKDVGWKVRQCLVWNKSSLVMGRQDYQWKHEPCLYGWKEGAAHYWGSDRCQTTVLDFSKPSRNGEHPTMKPLELFQYQVENSTKKGAQVLDLFGGSGTTLVACEKTGRHACLMELDPRYCDVIVKRWEQFTGKQAQRIAATANEQTPALAGVQIRTSTAGFRPSPE
jgi:site-specific DNA-methyltransferase (adenine-specific)